MDKTKIIIFGSCVSRDVLEYDDNSNFELVGYFARCSLASLNSTPSINHNILNNIESKFQRKSVENDMSKTFLQCLDTVNYDIFLLDLIDERFHLVINDDGTYHTYSSEYKNALKSKPKLLNTYDEKKFLMWKKGLEKIINILLKNKSLDKLYINKVLWNTNIKSNLPNIYTDEEIITANEFLTRMYHEIEKYVPKKQFINYSPALFYCDSNHKWGYSPFHYNEKLYRSTLAFLENAINEKETMIVEDKEYATIQIIILSDKKIRAIINGLDNANKNVYAFYLMEDNIKKIVQWYSSDNFFDFDIESNLKYKVLGFIKENPNSVPIILHSPVFQTESNNVFRKLELRNITLSESLLRIMSKFNMETTFKLKIEFASLEHLALDNDENIIMLVYPKDDSYDLVSYGFSFSSSLNAYFKYLKNNIQDNVLILESKLPENIQEISFRLWSSKKCLRIKNFTLEVSNGLVENLNVMQDKIEKLSMSKELIESDQVAAISNLLTNKNSCDKSCLCFVKSWHYSMDNAYYNSSNNNYKRDNYYFMLDSNENIPISRQNNKTAILEIGKDIDSYLTLIGDKSRNMIRKAQKTGYYYKEVNPNDYIDDIYQIRISDLNRQGRSIPDYYKVKPKFIIDESKNKCILHQMKFFGLFHDNTLCAYITIKSFGELAQIDHILGHKEHLQYGIMNLLVYSMIESLIKSNSSIKFINYLYMSSKSTMSSFKRSLGFRERITITYDSIIDLSSILFKYHNEWLESQKILQENAEKLKIKKEKLQLDNTFFAKKANNIEEAIDLVQSLNSNGVNVITHIISENDLKSFLSKELKLIANDLIINDIVAFNFFQSVHPEVSEENKNLIERRFKSLKLSEQNYKQGFKGSLYEAIGTIVYPEYNYFDCILVLRKIK